jgi:hypothetical protein
MQDKRKYPNHSIPSSSFCKFAVAVFLVLVMLSFSVEGQDPFAPSLPEIRMENLQEVRRTGTIRKEPQEDPAMPWEEVLSALRSREVFNETADFMGWKLHFYWRLSVDEDCLGTEAVSKNRNEEDWADLLSWEDPESGEQHFCAPRALLGQTPAEPDLFDWGGMETPGASGGLRLTPF